jgi:membrane-bound ClpP family serine protease
MDAWIWALVLLALGLSLTATEVFVPSGGVVSLLAACSLLTAIYMAFRQGSGVGFGILAGVLLGVPLVVAIALQWWPKTAMGQRMLLKMPESHEILPDSPKQRFLKGLVGRVGQAKSKMLLSGAVTIDGHTIDAVSEGAPIEVGQRVRVIEVRANRVIVRLLSEENADKDDSNPLVRPIDSITSDPFEDPPAG